MPARAAGGGGGAPVVVDVDAAPEVARWRPLLAWLLVIPHLVVMYVVALVAYVCMVIAFFSVLFTKRIPPGVHDWLVRLYRYQWQIGTYALWMHEEYPPWGGTAGDVDTGDHPSELTIERADELKRFGPLYKWILAIPHFFVLAVLGVIAYVVVIIAFFATLFTGKWPEGMRTFVVNVFRWGTRVNAYVLLRDEYPPFSLD